MLGLEILVSAIGLVVHVHTHEPAAGLCIAPGPDPANTVTSCTFVPSLSLTGSVQTTPTHGLRVAGRFDGALASTERASKHSPDSFRALVKAAALHSKQGNYDEALQDVNDALSARPLSIPVARVAQAFVVKGIVLRRLGRTDDALAAYTDALRISPGNAGALNSKAWLLFLLGRFDEALQAADRVVAVRPDFSAARNTRAHILAALDKYDEAATDLRQSLGSGKGKVAVRYRKALVEQGVVSADSTFANQDAFFAALMQCLRQPGCILAEKAARN